MRDAGCLRSRTSSFGSGTVAVSWVGCLPNGYFGLLHDLQKQYLESLLSTTPLAGRDDTSESSGEVQVVVPKKKPPVIIQILDGDEPQTVGDPGETKTVQAWMEVRLQSRGHHL